EARPVRPAEALAGAEVFSLFLPPGPFGTEQLAGTAEGEPEEPAVIPEPVATGWEGYALGVTEALRGRAGRQRAAARAEDIQDIFTRWGGRVGAGPPPARGGAAGPGAPPAGAGGPGGGAKPAAGGASRGARRGRASRATRRGPARRRGAGAGSRARLAPRRGR